jgi:hypothetical protein
MSPITLDFSYIQDGARCTIRYSIEVKRPAALYNRIVMAGLPTQPSRKIALVKLFCALSLIKFMEATGAQPSQRRMVQLFGDIFPENSPWYLPGDGKNSGRWFLTSEPGRIGRKAEAIKAWCSLEGWQCAVLPAGYGFRDPRGGRLCLVAPPARKRGANIRELAGTVRASVPRIGEFMLVLEALPVERRPVPRWPGNK